MTLKTFSFRMSQMLAVAATCAVLSACVEAPPPARVAPPPPRPNVTVYAYPQQGQSPDQLNRDRYDCSGWATHQTGFDPGAPNMPARYQVQVVDAAPGAGVAVGAVSGGVLGALAAGPRNGGAGLLIGALAGGIIGGGVESSVNANAQAQADAQANAMTREQMVQIDHQAANYRRAISACLQGRGYSVQ